MKIKIAGAVCFALGALLVGYNVYNALFTGTEFERAELAGDGETVVADIDLTPGMNPARALIRAKYEISWSRSDIKHDMDGRELRAEITMLDADGKIVWEDAVDFRRDSEEERRGRTKDATQYLRTFDVPREGQYTFVSNVHVFRGSLKEIELVLKQNVTPLSVPIVVLGVILALAGLIMASADLIKLWLSENLVRRPKSS